MRSVIVGFSAPIKWKVGAEFIKLWQGGTPYSHVYLRTTAVLIKRDIIYQASHGDVNCISAPAFEEQNRVVAEFEYNIQDYDYVELLRYCVDELGKPYGYLGLLKIGLRKLFKIRGDGERSFHCSEFAARAIKSLATKDADFIEPVDLYKSLVANPQVRSVK